jgi:hypothetical protein
LSTWTNQEYGKTPIRQVIGFNADEADRAERGEGYSTDERQFHFPLLQWNWGRKRCEEYIRQLTGETWKKSCCVFCPFASGKPEILARYRDSPSEAADALFIEFVSLAFNPRMTLYASKSLRSVLEKDGNTEALRLFRRRLEECEWAAYRVRRIVWAKGRVDRKTERQNQGSRDQVVSGLIRQGAELDGEIPLLYARRRGETYPTLEEMLVAAPAVVADKCRGRFEEHWQKLSGANLWS